MANKKSKKQQLKQKLIHKYRLVILNEDTFQERFSIKLSRLNVFVFGGVFSILLVALTSVLIAFTSLKEFIPGYSSTALKKKATRLVYETDSLKQQVAVLTNYTKFLKQVLNGKVQPNNIDSLQKVAKKYVVKEEKLLANKEDSLFIEKVESRDRYPLVEGNGQKISIVFFSPISGNITGDFDGKEKHYAIDIAAKEGTAVKSVADGTVLLSEWNVDTGYVIMLQHRDDFISVYKHNGALLKEQGDVVKLGEVIANVGSTGELTTGPHLHFELWHKGYPVNPLNYIDFQ